MITNAPPPRGAGRPRTFDDDAIFAATARALIRLGYTRLTLAAVAEELGSSPPALSKRFRSKRRLLLEFGEWSVRATEERFQQVRRAHASPLEALQAHLLPTETRTDEADDAEGFSRHLAFYLETARDPEFRELWDRRFQIGEEQIVLSLDQARAHGELAACCDVPRLSRTLQAALTGAALLATIDPRQSMRERLLEVFESVVGPHRTRARD